jgi:hypothetical protein
MKSSGNRSMPSAFIDPTGSSNLTDVRKVLSSPSAGPAIGEARKRVRFPAKRTQAQLMVPDRVPDFAFHPMGFSILMVHAVHLRCMLLTLQLSIHD